MRQGTSRRVRRVAIGDKNWLFAGSEAGGKRAAILYSLTATCQQLGLDPFTYLRDVLARLPEYAAGAASICR